MSKEIGEEYASSLSDLTVNSKPLINMLTILAEENIEHAAVIVKAVEKHLEKVRRDIKLPVLYLVDSIIKNVGGAYTQLFAQIIVNMFCLTFKQVDEKTRSQMFKLRETWHDVFPAIKLYQLDVKVNLVDPAWPIQAQPPQSNIHVNPNFLKKPMATSQPSATATVPTPAAPPITDAVGPASDEEKMRSALAVKEQELLQLQRRKIEMELEQTRRQLAEQRKALERTAQQTGVVTPATGAVTIPVSSALDSIAPTAGIPVKQRLGPPVSSVASKPAGAPRIAPVRTAQLSHTRRRPDPRLARQAAQLPLPVQPLPTLQPPIVPNVFDIKPLEKTQRVMTKSRNAITIDVVPPPGIPDHVKNEPKRREMRKDPRLERRTKPDSENRRFHETTNHSKSPTKQLKSNNHKEVSILPAITDSKIISKLPPIPKISKMKHQSNDDISGKKNESAPSPVKRRKDNSTSPRSERKLRKNKEISVEKSYSPEKSKRSSSSDKTIKLKPKTAEVVIEDKVEPEMPVTFKELKNSTKERNYMRRNREKSESPEKAETKMIIEDSEPLVTEESVKEPFAEPTKVISSVVGSQDVDLRVLPKPSDSIAAVVSRKRPSTEALDMVAKKSKADKFDILFGDEDVDLRTLQPIDRQTTPPAPLLSKDEVTGSPSNPKVNEAESPSSPVTSPTKLDVVRAKLAEATKGKDRLGRPLLYKKLPDDPDERKRTMSMNSEDTDMRNQFNTDGDSDGESFDTSIKIIMSQADEQLKVGDINKQQYNLLMMQVLHLNEKQKLKEAKQRESLEASKRKLFKLQAGKDASASPNIEDEDVSMSPRSGPDTPPLRQHNSPTSFGDIDERVVPPLMHIENTTQDMDLEVSRFPGLSNSDVPMDSDLRVPPLGHFPDTPRPDGPPGPGMPDLRFPMRPPMNRMNFPPFQPMWRGLRPRMEDWNGPRNHLRMRGPMPPPFWRNQFDGRMPFDPRMAMPEPRMPAPSFPPLLGMKQGECPIVPYKNEGADPPLLGGPASRNIPPTDIKLLEYIDQDIMRTIDVDGVPREIRYYGEMAIVMLDWDDPRDITFLPGSRRVTFDDKERFLLNFNDDYTTVELDEQTFRVKFGTPTRELYINERWFECFFGGPPLNIMIDGKARMVQIEGPPPQVKVGLVKRTDLVAGKINIIVDATSMFPVFLDAKPQKFHVRGAVFTVRFVDALETVLINEKPFKVEFGGLPQPILVGKRRHFIRFSVLPRTIKAGQVDIKDMEGKKPLPQLSIQPPVSITETHVLPFAPMLNATGLPLPATSAAQSVQPSQNVETENSNPSGGLDMLASLMASSTAPTSQLSGYSLNEPSGDNSTGIPGLETSSAEAAPAANIGLPFLSNINVNDLFAKLVATGIVSAPPASAKPELQKESLSQPSVTPKPDVKTGRFERRNEIKRVDLLKPETLKVAQPGLISRLYGGMQCSGCGVRFPPERTVRYSQHLDWHFRQNRRDRQSARRAHSRHWHYDLSDWLQYEEIEDIEEREKSWFESQGTAGAANSNNPTAMADGSNPENPIASNAEQEALSVPAGLAPEDHLCALCGDKFDQFYNEDKEEWHLRKAVRHEEKNYHPLCFDDYKASLTMNESALEASDLTNEDIPKEDAKDDEVPMETEINDLIIQDADDDNDSVVEIISETPSEQVSQDSVQVEQEEDDDVVLKTEPVEQVLVDDEDTDEETERARVALDQAAVEEFDFSKIKVKLEPADPDDEPVITAEEELVTAQADTTHTSVMSSIDGNVQLEAPQVAPTLPIGGIRINITKSIPQAPKDIPEDSNSGACEETPVTEEPLPPGEEPEIEYKLKPDLENVNFNKQVPVQRGTELSGLCSIM